MVTVLMTVFNAGRYLGQAIESVLEQTFADYELLVMDDGSTDPEVHRVLDCVFDPRVKVLRFWPTIEERKISCRYATLINYGASVTTGEYMTYLCGDDFFLPDRLERMVALMAHRDVVYGAQRLLREDDSEFGVRETSGVLDDAFHRVDLNSVMHSRTAFERAGGWDSDPARWRDADALFWRRLTDVGYRFYPVPGGPTDAKRYRSAGVDQRVIAGADPWA